MQTIVDHHRIAEKLREAARKLAEGEADNIDLRMTPQNPEGCFEDEETRDAYWLAVGWPTGERFDGREHRVLAVCMAAAVHSV